MRLTQLLAPAMIVFACACLPGCAHAQGVNLTLHVNISLNGAPSGRKPHAAMSIAQDANTAIAWLVPKAGSESHAHTSAAPHTFTLTQKNKEFSPHLLVIPIGSNVEFPNLDPFFHNVFSLYNGRRFDLGLYEAGSRRSVRFDQEGVSYIFCNIHPEMGAVIVSLSTPYYAMSDNAGLIKLSNVPPGDYELNLWSQNVSAAELTASKQVVHVGAEDLFLPTITFRRVGEPTHGHLNKFGDAYKKPEQTPY